MKVRSSVEDQHAVHFHSLRTAFVVPNDDRNAVKSASAGCCLKKYVSQLTFRELVLSDLLRHDYGKQMKAVTEQPIRLRIKRFGHGGCQPRLSS